MDALRALAEDIQRDCGVSSVFIARYEEALEPRVESLVYLDRDVFFPTFSYALKTSPCECVYRESYFLCEEGIQKVFPGDNALKELSLEAYEGVLLKRGNEVLGHLAILDKKKISPSKERLLAYAKEIMDLDLF